MKTLDEVIKAYELCIHPNIRCLECPYHEDGCPENRKQDAFHYLLEYRDIKVQAEEAISKQLKIKVTEYNDPLTWDELKQMEGKPVWVEEKYSFSNEWHGGWEVICSVWDNEWDDDPYLSMTNEEYRHKDDMGETWQAYRKER